MSCNKKAWLEFQVRAVSGMFSRYRGISSVSCHAQVEVIKSSSNLPRWNFLLGVLEQRYGRRRGSHAVEAARKTARCVARRSIHVVN